MTFWLSLYPILEATKLAQSRCFTLPTPTLLFQRPNKALCHHPIISLLGLYVTVWFSVLSTTKGSCFALLMSSTLRNLTSVTSWSGYRTPISPLIQQQAQFGSLPWFLSRSTLECWDILNLDFPHLPLRTLSLGNRSLSMNSRTRWVS